MNLKKVMATCLLSLILQSCIAVVSGAAIGTASTLVLYDRRPVKIIYHDTQLDRQILLALQAHPMLSKRCHIVIATYRGTVLLAGQAPTQELKEEIEEITKSSAKIKRFYNEITIEGPSSELTRTSDAWITTKIKTELLATKHLRSGQFKVVTENGTVFLMGLVSREQATMAVNTIRKIDGVQRVVKIFEYTR